MGTDDTKKKPIDPHPARQRRKNTATTGPSTYGTSTKVSRGNRRTAKNEPQPALLLTVLRSARTSRCWRRDTGRGLD